MTFVWKSLLIRDFIKPWKLQKRNESFNGVVEKAQNYSYIQPGGAHVQRSLCSEQSPLPASIKVIPIIYRLIYLKRIIRTRKYPIYIYIVYPIQ